MLNNEEIQKIQFLLNGLQTKKDSLYNKKQNLEVELKISEQQINQLKEYFKNELNVENIEDIESEMINIEKDIKNWIEQTEKVLNDQESELDF